MNTTPLGHDPFIHVQNISGVKLYEGYPYSGYPRSVCLNQLLENKSDTTLGHDPFIDVRNISAAKLYEGYLYSGCPRNVYLNELLENKLDTTLAMGMILLSTFKKGINTFADDLVRDRNN